ncbi:hypothetical protein E1B28_001150 [Marasmius oreades]|uniref:RlpA-like protein double-psi beta-barrel domain-containing protein n=1 Tax=Marasmius oreades TaxID=181124 RepID=A0A9P7V2T0_9AGAR|nr:uncharacterized protein E1B28_001150 [Marasmius oreades]KAG7099291.1 hypothetical protein E1B28_001150 [Marasmius oreades]
MFTKSLVILIAAISFANVVLASPHLVNRRHHHALAARGHSVTRNASVQLENRALRKRCRSRSPPSSSSTVAVSSPTPVNVAPSTTVSSSSTTAAPEQQTPTPPPPPPPASTTSSQESAPTQASDNNGQGGNNSNNNGGNNGGGVLGLPSFAVGPLTGQGTFYDTGLTACGDTYSDDNPIVAVSRLLFDIWPGGNGNPNLNPICNKKIRAHYNGNSVDLTIVDRCDGCAMYDIDMTPSAFTVLASKDLGRLSGVTWEFI